MARESRVERKTLGRGMVLTAALAALLLAGYGGYRWWDGRPDDARAGEPAIHNIDIAGDQAMIIEPANFSGNAVLVVHGSGADQGVTRLPYMEAFTEDLLDAGWIVASAYGAGEAWGSLESQEAYAALGRALESDYGVQRTVVVSVSMGGIAGLDLTAAGAIESQVGWFGVNTVTDLGAVYESGDIAQAIDAVMGPEERAAVDPARLVASDFAVPLVVFVGDADRVVSADVHAFPFADRTGATVNHCPGGHVDVTCFRADELLDLFG